MKNKLLITKRMITVVLTASMLCTVAGCGKSNEAKSASTESQIAESQKAEPFNGNTSLSTCFKEDGIWYLVEDDKGIVGKDSDIECVIVAKGGKVKLYHKHGTLGELAKLSDAEIMDKLEEQEKRYWEEQTKTAYYTKEIYKKMLEKGLFDTPVRDICHVSCDTYIATYDFTSLKGTIEQVISNMPNFDYPDEMQTYSVKAETDQTGNRIQTETLTINGTPRISTKCIGDSEAKEFVDIEKDWEFGPNMLENIEQIDINADNQVDFCYRIMNFRNYDIEDRLAEYKANIEDYRFLYYVPANVGTCTITITGVPDFGVGPNGAFQVYDSEYSGFRCKDEYLLTRTKGRVEFTFDKIDAKGIEID